MTNHTWKFFRAGGTDQVRLESAQDILSLDQLDQKLWVALSCPVRGLEGDTHTLELIDTDHDGRIRVPEILAAVRWLGSTLKDLGESRKGSDTLPLAAINDTTDEGRQLLEAARQILANLGKADAKTICLADTSDTVRIFAQTKFNGDGIVPAESAKDEPTRKVIQDIIACLGAEADRSGLPGISQAKADQFFADLQAYADWQAKAEKEAASILPLGDKTPAAFAILQAVRAKIDDYFARCRLAAFDSRAVSALNRQESEFQSLAAKDLSLTTPEIAGFPVARVEAGKPLPLVDGVNPAWAAPIAQLHSQVVKPLLGEKNALTAAEWQTLCARLAPFEAWQSARAGSSVESLGLDRIRQILSGPFQKTIADLIAQDRALEPQANGIADVDRLLRYNRDLYQLLNNFVAFADFYSGRRKAIFQAGTLYLDSRACDLCVRVDDPAKHGALAALSKTYLAYCDCTRRGAADKMTIAAAFTAGDSDNLMVGRNGVFYDRKGQDWDATIVKIIDQPISIGQAFWSPYKKFIRLIEQQIEKFASAREKAAEDKMAAGVAGAAQKIDAPKAAAPPTAFDIGKMVGIFAAIGLAIGAIGTAIAALAGSFMNLVWWQKPVAIVAVMLLISAPSMIIAWLKLRQRNLGPILDANGWAVNGRVRINIPFGGALTKTAKLPPNSSRTLDDPYAEKRRGPLYLTILIILALAAAAAYGWHRYHKSQEAKTPQLEQIAPAGTNAPPA
ncbi:MAG TPA: hypothetical protein P5555_05130 [Candidatus Paceibacterota bacterium]|nr:hypothetical protein [Verrucomicrobiota bacterium]HRZ44555.1 hypothetical protein [Candidatus Paceibacterota bacterium]